MAFYKYTIASTIRSIRNGEKRILFRLEIFEFEKKENFRNSVNINVTRMFDASQQENNSSMNGTNDVEQWQFRFVGLVFSNRQFFLSSFEQSHVMDPATSYPRGNDRVESRRSASLCRGSNKWQVFINSRPDSALGDDSEEKHVASIELCEQNETREDCENVT